MSPCPPPDPPPAGTLPPTVLPFPGPSHSHFHQGGAECGAAPKSRVEYRGHSSGRVDGRRDGQRGVTARQVGAGPSGGAAWGSLGQASRCRMRGGFALGCLACPPFRWNHARAHEGLSQAHCISCDQNQTAFSQVMLNPWCRSPMLDVGLVPAQPPVPCRCGPSPTLAMTAPLTNALRSQVTFFYLRLLKRLEGRLGQYDQIDPSSRQCPTRRG